MEIGGLGLVNVMTANQSTPEKSDKLGSFAGMMQSVLSGTSTNSTETSASQANTDTQGLIELLAFLKNTDLLELEEGGHVLENIMSNAGELFEKALSHFGMTDEGLLKVIEKWTDLTGTSAEEEAGKELHDVLSGLIAAMAALPIKEIASKLDSNDRNVLKALKLYELMTKYADGKGYSPDVLRESLKALGSSLETAALQTTESEQAAYLQNRFTRLAGELNLLNSKKSSEIEFIADNDHVTASKSEGMAGPVTFLPHISKAEQLTLMLHEQGKPVSADQLIKQFESLMAKSQFINSGGTQKLFIKLFPEHLGSIRVELFQKDSVMMARIITSTGSAKEVLESQVNGLKQAFAAQSISVDRIEIFQQSPQQDRFLNRDSQQQQYREPQKQNKEEQNDDKGEFSLSLEDALLSIEI